MMEVVLPALLGVLLWTFLEYLIHRFMGHYRPWRGNIFEQEHTRHHSQGNYFAPAWKKGGAAVLVTAILSPPAVLLVGWAPGLSFVLGFVTFYLTYELLHRLAHVHAGVGFYGRWLRRHHFHHHFVHPKMNHGVTSPIWDVVFGTYEAPAQIPVPEKLAMQWLVDPSTGDVFERHSQSYSLVRRKVAA